MGLGFLDGPGLWPLVGSSSWQAVLSLLSPEGELWGPGALGSSSATVH